MKMLLPTVVLLLVGSMALAQSTTRVSVSSDGTEGNSDSRGPHICGSGRVVAFHSDATNLVAGDTNMTWDVFVHDLLTRATTRVSLGSNGAQGNDYSLGASLNADGRFVGFMSSASNLVAGDTNGETDSFVRDLITGTTERISVSSGGTQGDDSSGGDISFSANGRFVVFFSRAENLVTGDTNGWGDTFVRDRQAGTTTRVSVSSSGKQGPDGSYGGNDISSDGQYVVFDSYSPNLVPDDTNVSMDIFVHDRVTQETTRVSVATDGSQGNAKSYSPRMSPNGRYVTFWSAATNLVPNDTNGVRDVFVHDRLTSQTVRVSMASDGTEGDSYSHTGGISADGRYTTFDSGATTLVPDDTNGVEDVFLRDLSQGSTVRLSVSSLGEEGNGGSVDASLDDSGVVIAFASSASNLVSGDTNGVEDVFVTLAVMIFFDGFESGDTSAWSRTVQ